MDFLLLQICKQQLSACNQERNFMNHIKTVLLGTLGYLLEYRQVLIRALLVPFILYIALDAMEEFNPDRIARIGLFIAGLIVQTMFAITTHRVILLGPNQIPRWGMLTWTRREMLFAMNMIRLGLMTVPLILLVYIPIIGLALTVMLMIWVLSRLSLIFPAIAIDHTMSLKTSWQLTRQYQLMMVFVVVVLPAILAFPIYFLKQLPYSFFLTSPFSTFTTVFTVTALSVAYKIIQRDTMETQP